MTLTYAPRPLQEGLHRELKRFNVLVAHRRFGKTVFCINHTLHKAAKNERDAPRYAYIAPLFRQAKAVAWDYLKQYTRQISGVQYHESELRCDLPSGARVSLYGADNPDSLRGLYFDGVVLDEYGQMRPNLWPEVIRPALSDRLGWAIFIGTPMGRNAFWTLYEQARALRRAGGEGSAWFTALYRASETGVLPERELRQAAQAMSPDQYAQEFECSFAAAVSGSYYGKLLEEAEAEKRIAAVPWERGLPVGTAWDLGVGDSTAIWFFQQAGRELRLIDHYESSGVGLEHYAKLLREKPYVYGEHLLPHDVQVKELGTGKSRLEVLAGLGIRARVVANLPVDDGIQAVRNLLPRCWIDAEKCRRGVEALRHYRRDYNDKLRAFKARPLHDWSSHSADALRYLAVGLRGAAPAGWDKPIAYKEKWIV